MPRQRRAPKHRQSGGLPIGRVLLYLFALFVTTHLNTYVLVFCTGRPTDPAIPAEAAWLLLTFVTSILFLPLTLLALLAAMSVAGSPRRLPISLYVVLIVLVMVSEWALFLATEQRSGLGFHQVLATLLAIYALAIGVSVWAATMLSRRRVVDRWTGAPATERIRPR